MEQKKKFDKSDFVFELETPLLDSYDINYEIGSGAYSKVYEVKEKVSQDIRACKYIAKKDFKEEDIKKFEKEIAILKEFDHPNIIKLYDYFNTPNSFYLIMEKCNGGNLYFKILERINLEKMFDEKILSEVFKQIISAINYCHDEGVCHRDLKPENICFLNLGNMENNTVKIIDFGFGRVISPKEKLKTKVGSSLYMAPEVLKHKYNEKCDIWSIGVILFFIISGKPPFFGENEMEIQKKILSIDYKFDDTWKNVSDDVKDLISHMLVKEDQRYSAKQALEHPWIQKYKKNEINTEINVNQINQLKLYQKMDEFEKKIITFISNRISQNEINNIKNFFVILDYNDDGRISFEEFTKGILALPSVKIKKEDIKPIFDKIDTNEDGKIGYTEFISSCINENLYLKKEYLVQVFEAFDKTKKGKIGMHDIISVLGLDTNCCKRLKALFNKLDKDDDGKINLGEFIKMFSIIISETLNRYKKK